jgi:hypothetical protein
MNIALERLFEGIVATLRTNVIPHVEDSYARGQAVGVIDLINNIAPQVEWARGPLIDSVGAKRRLLRSIADAVDVVGPHDGPAAKEMGSAELLAERVRLDALVCEAIEVAHARPPDDLAAKQALGLLIRHAHDEAAAQMKRSRKPLFAEIASGRNSRIDGPRR